MNGSISPRRSIIASVAGWVVAARGLSSTLDSASRSVTLKPFRAQASAATTPTGPAPATMMRGLFTSMTDLAEIVKNFILHHTHFLHWRRGVPAAADEPRHAIGYDGRHGGNITVPQRIERILLRSAEACIEHHNVCIAPWFQESAVQPVYASVVACGCRDRPFNRHIGETRQIRDHVQHSERHDSAASRCIGRDKKAIELVRLSAKITYHQRRSKIPRRDDLHCDLAFINESRVVFIRHRYRSAVYMEGNVWLHGDQMLGPNACRSRYRRAAGMNGCNHAVFLCPCDQWHIVERCLNGTETRLRQPNAFGRHFLEIFFRQPRLENDRSGIDPHSAGTVILIALERCESECLDAFGIYGPAGDMNFRRRNCGRDPAMRVAFEKPNSLLPRRIVAKCVMHL